MANRGKCRERTVAFAALYWLIFGTASRVCDIIAQGMNA
ncbi:hypothetical protein SCH4B_0045 [Ruegeria sp. TrichCH4B]|nr:hypothetical protein SCH4B_0045 [Ruegeria sp. TrichCH4B]